MRCAGALESSVSGKGLQIRNTFHPEDLAELILRQVRNPETKVDKMQRWGGVNHSMSLLELSEWCTERFGLHEVASDASDRRFDVVFKTFVTFSTAMTFV